MTGFTSTHSSIASMKFLSSSYYAFMKSEVQPACNRLGQEHDPAAMNNFDDQRSGRPLHLFGLRKSVVRGRSNLMMHHQIQAMPCLFDQTCWDSFLLQNLFMLLSVETPCIKIA